jgi:carboxypeptidase Q
VFACRATPALFMGGADWSYDPYTWHTNRDTYDKVVFDDLRHNAVLAAMLAYEAADDSAFVSRTKSPGRWPPTWPANCGKARRSTTPP